MAAVVFALAKQLTRFFYRLTVGLTVLLIKALLLCTSSLATVGLLAAFVVLVTWKTYVETDHNLGLTAGACALAILVCAAVVFVLHWLARDVFKLTTLSLPELIRLVVPGGRRSKVAEHKEDNHERAVPRAAAGGDNAVDGQVETRRRVVVHTTSYKTADGITEKTTTVHHGFTNRPTLRGSN